MQTKLAPTKAGKDSKKYLTKKKQKSQLMYTKTEKLKQRMRSVILSRFFMGFEKVTTQLKAVD